MGYKSPAYGVIAVPIEKIRANTYNPTAIRCRSYVIM